MDPESGEPTVQAGAAEPRVDFQGILPETETVCVEYPAIVQDVEKALETLGGPDEVGKAEKIKESYLQLFWKPSEPHCHALVGQKQPSCGFLIRVSRPKKESNANADAESADFTAQIVARLNSTYRFTGLADYGFGAKQDLPDQSSWVPGTKELSECSESLRVLPPFFSKVDVPLKYGFRSSGTVGSRDHAKRCRVLYGEVIGDTSVSFYPIDRVPEARTFNKIEPETLACSEALTDIFKDRKIWSLQMLMLEINGRWQQSVVASLLVGLAYKFRTGPWANLFIWRGYDPREDQKSRIYQGVEYILPKLWRGRRMPQNSKSDGVVEPNILEINKFSALPSEATTTLQLIDLDDQQISTTIHAEDGLLSHCAEKTGWFSLDNWALISAKVSERFGSLLYELSTAKEEHKNEPTNILPPEVVGQLLAGINWRSNSDGSGTDPKEAEVAGVDDPEYDS